jgi:hypothetical protein
VADRHAVLSRTGSGLYAALIDAIRALQDMPGLWVC